MADDWIQPYQVVQIIGNSAECCDDCGRISFTRNMSMKESRWAYHYAKPKHSQLIRNRERKLHHRTSCRLDTAGDWIRQYQIMLNNRKMCRTAAYGTHCTYCSERSNTKSLWIAIQLRLIQARICIQQHIFQIPAGRQVFRVLWNLMCHFLLRF